MAKRKQAPIVDPADLPDVSDSPATEDELSFLQFLEAHGVRLEGLDPLSDEGLRYQALYIANFSQHPMDVMRRIMQNPYSDPKDRLSAAKSLMEYSMRKPAANVELRAKGAAVVIDPSRLSALSVTELETLEKLLEKTA